MMPSKPTEEQRGLVPTVREAQMFEAWWQNYVADYATRPMSIGDKNLALDAWKERARIAALERGEVSK